MSDLLSTPDEERVQAIRERLAKHAEHLRNIAASWLDEEGNPHAVGNAEQYDRTASDLDYLLRENDALRNDLQQSLADRVHEETLAAKLQAELSTARAALSEAETLNAKFWRWAYALNVAAAKAQLALRNAKLREADEPNTWPAQSEWNELVSSSHSIFLRAMREAAGIDHDDFLAYVRNERGERYAEIADEIYQHSASAPSGESQHG
jgi:hypothetical protein